MNLLKSILLIAFILFATFQASAQEVMTLDETVRRVITTHPSVRQAEEAVKSAGYNIKLAKSVLLPILNVSASYTRIDPVATVHFENMDLSFDPQNNYNAGIYLRQLVYDFGKNRPKIEAAKEKEELAQMQQEETFQSLALNAIQLYCMNYLAQQAIHIKKQELVDYDEMLRQSEILTRSGSATSFDLLSTKVSQSAVNTQLTELNAQYRTLQVQLSVLADTVISEFIPLSQDFEMKPDLSTLDELLTIAYVSRIEMQMAEKQIYIAQLEEGSARRAYNPSLDLSASAGGKNGYPVHLDRMKLNYEVGVTLSIPLYEGGRRKQSVSLARSAYNTALMQKELIEKEVTQQVSENYNTFISNSDKIKQLVLRVELSQKAYEQARVNYKAGTITNLELLTSVTNVSGSRLQLLQAKIDQLISYYKLQVSIGKRIW